MGIASSFVMFLVAAAALLNAPAGVIMASSSIRYVPTPFGYKPSSCVHNVGTGAVALDGSALVFANGTRYTPPDCPFSRPGVANQNPPPSLPVWVEDAKWASGIALGYFTGNWVVPRTPTANDGQVIFLFTGFEDGDQTATEIIQPVLQYGVSAAGGGNFWAIASWWVTSGNSYLVSTLVTVHAGDSINGVIYEPGHCGPNYVKCNWQITTTDTTTQTSTALTKLDKPLSYAYVTLEVSGFKNCNDYPASGTTTFTGLQLQDIEHNPVTPSWTTQLRNTYNCGEQVVINSASSVTLNY